MKHNFKELQIWSESMDFSVEVYELIKKLPKFEEFGLSSQITRASISIPSNIAEGCSRYSNKDIIRFIDYSIESSFEVETQIILISKIYPDLTEDCDNLLSRIVLIQRKLGGFKRLIKSN